MEHSTFRWMLVDGFIDRFNEHRHETFLPSFLICVYESMSCWYSVGGDWINMGLPMYGAMDRKPKNGMEVQDACCALSGIMIRMRILKGKDFEKDQLQFNDEDEQLLHGVKVLKELMAPWTNTNRIVCADSYFSSVSAAEELLKDGWVHRCCEDCNQNISHEGTAENRTI